ncbi:galactoside alpha-(1,2)-fucosyltransferase 2 isoform X3 [Dendroctonus ponderosae]|uniref:galactoside alpha-(1,2)-fucosyltransferase 2 isoform X3 n=1 Tax=Dendroctonus ponderosae TaxID=77166 RepID=UPI002034FFC2|nr:galactoside alpha-(1,2)-fucosyltransferase 2 isoform X3 [Dendroctonus ponderosae]
MIRRRRSALIKLSFLIWILIFIYFLFPLFGNSNEVVSTTDTARFTDEYSFRDFEGRLCKVTRHNPTKRCKPTKKRLGPCPKEGITSMIFTHGHTGNQMWEYASVWAVARRTGLEPYVPRCIRNRLKEIFDMLTVPGFEDIAHCPVEFKTFVNSIEEWTSTNQSIILPRYTLQPELVLTWVQDIRQEFHFNKEIRNKAQRVLLDLSRKLPRKEYTFVGVHVRRTDYQGYLDRKYGEKLVTKAFFINAMNYFNSKYSNCLFIYVSDDPGWCSKQFGRMKNVFVASNENSPAEDMAILSYCNHTIYDYGTFGEWGALLAGGETIYLNMTQNMRKGTGKFMNWIPMK